MRISPAKLLIIVALGIVILVEVRTVLALFSIDVGVRTVVAAGGVCIGLLVLWATSPLLRRSNEQFDNER